MIINLALMAILLVVVAAIFRAGLLQGMMLFFNVLVAATFATAWYETLATYLERYLAPYTYFLDIVSLWATFALILVTLVTVTSQLFKKNVMFAPQVEIIGRILVGLLTGWTVVEFTALGLHTAPLKNEVVPMPPERSMLFGLKPDRCWLWWVRGSSRNGPFATPDEPFDKSEPDDPFNFFKRHEDRRKTISQEESIVRPDA
ncbi:hypothetical protein EBR56_04520 [bacterium]|nr:hypothetical protein [bacterium]